MSGPTPDARRADTVAGRAGAAGTTGITGITGITGMTGAAGIAGMAGTNGQERVVRLPERSKTCSAVRLASNHSQS